MDDIINCGDSYILSDNNGTLWYFFLGENKRIGHTTRKGDDWSSVKYLESQPLKGYSVTLDKEGVIQLLAYTETRQLLYYEFCRGKWSNRILERIYSRFQDIVYYDIRGTSSGTHIVYYINHSLSRSAETLVHYHISHGKWQGGRLWRFISDQFTRPVNIHGHELGGLSMIFTQRTKKRYHLYYSDYDLLSLSWSDPILIHSTDDNNDYRLFGGLNGDPYIVWSHKIGEGYEITLLSKHNLREDGAWVESLIHRDRDEILEPFLLMDESLHCFWREGDSIKGSSSEDFGATWSKPESFIHIQSPDTELTIHNLVALRNGIPRSMVFLGQDSPYYDLFGLYKYPLKEIIEVSKGDLSDNAIDSSLIEGSQDKSPDIIETQRALTSIKRDNRAIRESLNNLMGEIDRIDNIIYSLQEQVGINEQALFNINARIRQLDFQLNQARSKTTRTRSYNIQNSGYMHQNSPMKAPSPEGDVKPLKTDPSHGTTENSSIQDNEGGNNSTQEPKTDDRTPSIPRNKDIPGTPTKRNITIKTRPLYDYRDDSQVEDSAPIESREKIPPEGDKPVPSEDLIDINTNSNPQENYRGYGESKSDTEANPEIKEQAKNTDPKDVDEYKDAKSHEKDNTAKSRIESHVMDDNEDSPKEKKDIQKISLGSTTILINPEDPNEL